MAARNRPIVWRRGGWEKIPEKYPTVSLNQYVIMPKPYSFDPIFLGRTDGGRPARPPQQAYRLAQRWLEKTREISAQFHWINM